MNNALKIPRSVALAVVATLATLGVAVSFMESYRALYWWATGHRVHGTWAILWPIQIDAFIAVGELALFVALVDSWKWKARALPWLITGAGLAVSVAGNVGHLTTTNPFDRLTAAIPPLTAYVMLAAALGILKRVIANTPTAAVAAPAREVQQPAAAVAPEPAPYGYKKDGTPRRKPGPEPGTPRPSRPVPVVTDAPVNPHFAETLRVPPREITVDTGNLYRALPATGAYPGWTPTDSQLLPRLGADGLPVNGNGS